MRELVGDGWPWDDGHSAGSYDRTSTARTSLLRRLIEPVEIASLVDAT